MRFISALEWEGLQEKLEIQVASTSASLPPNTTRVEIYRDDAYNIRVDCFGQIMQTGELDEWVRAWHQVGEDNFIDPLNFEISDSIWIYQLNHCIFDAARQISASSSCQGLLDFEATFFASSMSVIFCESSEILETAWLTEWYLNAPRGDFFTRFTTRELSTKYKRTRSFTEEEIFDYPDRETSALDHSVIKLENFEFIVHAVPEQFTPEWSKCLGIEYRKSWGSIPTPEDRETIAEAIGFIAGRHLLNVGFTEFSSDNYAIKNFMKNPTYSLGHNLLTLCQTPDAAPVKLEDMSVDGDIQRETENILRRLIPNYLLLRNSLNLRNTFHRFWLFKELPIGDNLPILAAGIETLAAEYLKYREIELTGLYMDKQEFKQLLKEELKQIKKKLQGRSNGEAMISKICGAYSYPLGVNQTLKRFFEELQLNIDEIETEAMAARNVMTHSSVNFSDEVERRRMIKLTNAYETLFNRIMLKILGFEGKYINYYSQEYLQQPIDEPIRH